MRVKFIETKNDGFVQVAYIERLYVNGLEVMLELAGERKYSATISVHESDDAAKKALKTLMKRIGFGQVLKAG